MPETEKIYEKNSYQTEFDAVIEQCIKVDVPEKLYDIVLDRTCFFPEGGGQPSDRGLLDSACVLDVQEKNGVVFHRISMEFAPGSKVHGIIDWERRFSNMQQHSGEHILSGIINQRHGLDNVGFHIGSEFVTLDFNGLLTEEQLREAETLANEAVYANLPVDIRFPEPEELSKLIYRSKKELDGMIRIVTIPGCDRCACCGTHVRNTGEIGIIKIISAQKYKGGVRISILCGARALEHFRKALGSVDEISVLLSARPDLVSEAVKQLNNENGRLKTQIKETRRQLIAQKAAQISPDSKLYTGIEEGLSSDELKDLALLLAQRSITSVIFSGNEAEGYKYAVASTAIDARDIAKRLNSELNGRGGGTDKLAQGSVRCCDEALENFVKIYST